jgi:hypothetical protein
MAGKLHTKKTEKRGQKSEAAAGKQGTCHKLNSIAGEK